MVAQGQDTNHAACFFGSTQIAAVGSMNGSLYPGTARFADVPPRQNTGDWVFRSPGPYSVPIVVDRPLAENMGCFQCLCLTSVGSGDTKFLVLKKTTRWTYGIGSSSGVGIR